MDEIMGYLALLAGLVVVGAVMILAAKAIRIVPQATVLLIERLGKFSHVASGGLNFLTPFWIARVESIGRGFVPGRL